MKTSIVIDIAKLFPGKVRYASLWDRFRYQFRDFERYQTHLDQDGERFLIDGWYKRGNGDVRIFYGPPDIISEGFITEDLPVLTDDPLAKKIFVALDDFLQRYRRAKDPARRANEKKVFVDRVRRAYSAYVEEGLEELSK